MTKVTYEELKGRTTALQEKGLLPKDLQPEQRTEWGEYNAKIDRPEERDELKKSNLHEALLKARQGFRSFEKSAKNKGVGSSYATLDDILGAVMPALIENDLSLFQAVDGGILDTVLVHVPTGEELSSSIELESLMTPRGDEIKGRDGKVQARKYAWEYGSALSYARRYGINALLCLPGEIDDDGVAAAPVEETTPATRPQESPQVRDDRRKTSLLGRIKIVQDLDKLSELGREITNARLAADEDLKKAFRERKEELK